MIATRKTKSPHWLVLLALLAAVFSFSGYVPEADTLPEVDLTEQEISKPLNKSILEIKDNLVYSKLSNVSGLIHNWNHLESWIRKYNQEQKVLYQQYFSTHLFSVNKTLLIAHKNIPAPGDDELLSLPG